MKKCSIGHSETCSYQFMYQTKLLFLLSTVNSGSTAKLLTNPTQEQELWKQEKGTNGIWYKAGIYHLGEEEGKFQTMAKAMLKNTCLKAGETWNYWGDSKWYKNNGVVIKCGC